MIPARLVRDLNRKNVASIVFAAGNSGVDCGGLPSVLCINSNEGGVTVGVTDQNGAAQPYSARGPGQCSPGHPFITAPSFGGLPWGSGWRDFGALGGGSSSAAPQIAGALALMKAAYPQAQNPQLQTALALGASRRTFSLPGLPPWDPAMGFGQLRVDQALDRVATAPFSLLHSAMQARAVAPSPAAIGLPLADVVR